jgi:hypothetical protein
MECKKCKAPAEDKEHHCSHCDYKLCRRCDDNSQQLNWWGLDPKNRDGCEVYLCVKCLKKHLKKSEPERV